MEGLLYLFESVQRRYASNNGLCPLHGSLCLVSSLDLLYKFMKRRASHFSPKLWVAFKCTRTSKKPKKPWAKATRRLVIILVHKKLQTGLTSFLNLHNGRLQNKLGQKGPISTENRGHPVLIGWFPLHQLMVILFKKKLRPWEKQKKQQLFFGLDKLTKNCQSQWHFLHGNMADFFKATFKEKCFTFFKSKGNTFLKTFNDSREVWMILKSHHVTARNINFQHLWFLFKKIKTFTFMNCPHLDILLSQKWDKKDSITSNTNST